MRALILVAMLIAPPPPSAVAQTLEQIHVLNKTGKKVTVWIQATTFLGWTVDVPVQAGHRELVAFPSQTWAGVWVDRVYIGAWDGITPSQTISRAFLPGPSVRRFVIRLDPVTGHLQLKEV